VLLPVQRLVRRAVQGPASLFQLGDHRHLRSQCLARARVCEYADVLRALDQTSFDEILLDGKKSIRLPLLVQKITLHRAGHDRTSYVHGVVFAATLRGYLYALNVIETAL